MHIGPREFARYILLAFFSFFNKIQDGRKNPMSLSRARTASWICFMFGSKELPYPGCVLMSFLCDYDNKNFFLLFLNFFLIFQDFQLIFQFLLILAIIKIW